VVVLVGVPVGQAVHYVGYGVEVGEGDGGLVLVRRQEVWGVVFECFDELGHWLSDSVVGVVGRGTVAERKGFFECVFVFLKDAKGRF